MTASRSHTVLAAAMTAYVSAATAFSVWHPSTHGIQMFGGGEPHDHAPAFGALNLLAWFGVTAGPGLVALAALLWIDLLCALGSPRWSKPARFEALLILATIPVTLVWALPALFAPVLGVVPALACAFIAVKIARTPVSPPTSQP